MQLRRYKITVLVLFVLVLTLGNTAKKTDSLDVQKKHDSIRKHMEQDRTDSAIRELRELLKHREKMAMEDQAVTYRLMSRAYDDRSALDSSAYYMEKAWQLARKVAPEKYGTTYPLTLAYYSWEMGNYSQALKYAQMAKRNVDGSQVAYDAMRLQNVLGLIYRDLGNYQRAESHFMNAIGMSKRLEQKHYRGIILANLGSLYQREKDYDKAISYYERGSTIELEYEDYKAAGRSFAVIGELYTDQQEYSKALDNLEKAKKYNARADDLVGLCRTRNALGKLYTQTGDYRKAREYYLDAESLARHQGARKELMKSYQGLYKNYGRSGNHKKAFSYQSRYLDLYKDLYSIQEIVKLENLQHKLNLQRQKNKNQQEQIRKQNTINRLLLILAILSVVLTLVFILLFMRIRRSKKSLQQKNKEIHTQKIKLEKLNQHLTAARKEAEKSEQLKDQFLRNISHEIRTPLNGILGFSSIIAEGNLEKEQRKQYHSYIKRNAKLLLSTIDDILDIARIRTKQVEVYRESFQVCHMMKELKEMFAMDRHRTNGENIELLLDLAHPDEDFRLYSDPTKIRKVLMIMMDNALKFTREGFVRMGYFSRDSEVVFYVQDTGIGISQEDQNLIYESFRQAESELSRKYDGMGVGLSIAKSFIETLNGNIWFDSTPGKGTTFYFSIPYNKAA